MPISSSFHLKCAIARDLRSGDSVNEVAIRYRKQKNYVLKIEKEIKKDSTKYSSNK